jgi:hypothetical protein
MFQFSNGFLGWKLLVLSSCELQHCHGGESNRWAKVQASFTVCLNLVAQP